LIVSDDLLTIQFNCPHAMQLVDEVEPAQVLVDKCVYASAVPYANSKTDGSDGRRILGEELETGKLKHPPARPPFGCIVSLHL
jgi:hypothetical protein